MASLVLVTDNKYEGSYVAFPSFTDRKVVASGAEPSMVYQLAAERGFPEPVVIYIPQGNMTQIY